MLELKKRRLELPRQKDFRIFLQNELARRCQKNPKYSLRAFAKFLDAAPSFLSHLLNGKRSVTPSTITSFSKRLGLDPTQTQSFREYHLRNKMRSDEVDTSVSLNQLTLDQFQVISDWYHYAILELLLIDDFKPYPKWVARVLGISVSEVNGAIERLQRLEMLRISEDGKWLNDSGNNTTVGNEFTAVAFRNLQRQILEKAVTALEELPIEKRDQSSLTMAMDSEFMPEIKECIKKFRRQLVRFQERSKKKNQIYQLSVSFYPILKNSIKEKDQ